MITVAITGASGSIMGIRLIEELINLDKNVNCIISSSGFSVMAHELQITDINEESFLDLINKRKIAKQTKNLKIYNNKNFYAPAASGTSGFKAIVAIPCSMKTLSAVANSYADSLITRACDVALKERKKCILVTRETPLNLAHIENMKKATLSGAIIAPPVPGFYTMPETIDDIVNFTVGKVLNLLDIEHSLFPKWGV